MNRYQVAATGFPTGIVFDFLEPDRAGLHSIFVFNDTHIAVFDAHKNPIPEVQGYLPDLLLELLRLKQAQHNKAEHALRNVYQLLRRLRARKSPLDNKQDELLSHAMRICEENGCESNIMRGEDE